MVHEDRQATISTLGGSLNAILPMKKGGRFVKMCCHNMDESITFCQHLSEFV